MDARTAIKVLREVKRDPIKRDGVCNNFTIKAIHHCQYEEITSLRFLVDFSKYPGFSGNTKYPLPGGEARFDRCALNKGFWSGTDGEERIKFIEWCISELEKEL